MNKTVPEEDKNRNPEKPAPELPESIMLPEVRKTRDNVREDALTVYEAPELTLPENPTELDRLKLSIIEAVEQGDINTAMKLQAQKNKIEIDMAKNLRKAHDASRRRYEESQKALSADDRERNWETRKKKMGDVAIAVGKGTWQVTKFLGKSGLFLGKKTVDLTRYLLKNTFGLARDISTEIHNGIVDMKKYREETKSRNPEL